MEITLITDFYGAFMTKVPSNPYKAGFDLKMVSNFFQKYNIILKIKRYSDFQFFEDYTNKIIIYTSIEDPNGNYRNYIDDVLYGLEQAGAILIPGYRFFKAHESKVFMEILRNIIFKDDSDITSYKSGSYSDFVHLHHQLKFPIIVKKSSGSASKGVYLLYSSKTLIKLIKRITNTHDYRSLLVDFLFAQKQRINKVQYINRFSLFRKKFIIQNFIGDLPNDFKILIFNSKYYVLKRLNRSNDFRASGSGKFLTCDDFEVSTKLLDNCEKWFKAFDVPCASFDVAYKENKYFLLEFQFISFGTYTQTSAKSYFSKKLGKWEKVNERIILEEVYTDSIVEYIANKTSVFR